MAKHPRHAKCGMASGVVGIIHAEDGPCMFPALPQGGFRCEACGGVIQPDADGDPACACTAGAVVPRDYFIDSAYWAERRRR